MQRFIAAALVVAALATPSLAGDRNGAYLGFYGGVGQRNPGVIQLDQAGAGFDDDFGAFEQPAAVLNNGLPDRVFDLLNLALFDFPWPDSAVGFGFQTDGTLDYATSPIFGVVAGYAVEGGLRLEADLSHALFRSTTGEIEDGEVHTFIGVSDPDTGEWLWETTSVGPAEGGPVSSDAFAARTATTMLFANAWYDIGAGLIAPYLGGGLGVALIDTSWAVAGIPLADDSVVAPAAQLGAGVRLELGEVATFDLGYRYRLALAPDRYGTALLPGAGNDYFAFGFGESGAVGIHLVQAGLAFSLD